MKHLSFNLFLILSVLLSVFGTQGLDAQNFDTYFINQTLRLDYIFSGNATSQSVSLHGLSRLPQWTGRRGNLGHLIREGNGQIIVTDLKSDSCIYMESFSSLFQEWLTTPAAETQTEGFENTFLIPYPRQEITVEVRFREKDGSYTPMLRHTVDPRDILIRQKGETHVLPYKYIHKGGDPGKCINVAILAEGYTQAEIPKFIESAQITVEEIFKHTPFGQMKDKLNFVAVESLSDDSGVSQPAQKVWRSTAFSSHFDTFYSDRYLTTSHVFDVHDALAGIPYNHIIILANTDTYGGGGIYNAFTLTTTGHSMFKPVVVHEFGHSFAGLADEYFYEGDIFDNTYPRDVEPWEPNITTLVRFVSKWENLLAKGTPIPTPYQRADEFPVGVFEGAGYSTKGVYRPAIECRMRNNTYPDFCPACQQAIRQLIDFYTMQ